MVIKSNYKDYYDYMVAKFGRDPKIVYMRVCQTKDWKDEWQKTGLYRPLYELDPKTSMEHFLVYFCGRMYHTYYLFGDWYDDKVVDVMRPDYQQLDNNVSWERLKQWQASWDRKKTYGNNLLMQGKETDLNNSMNCPVLVRVNTPLNIGEYVIRNPMLSKLGFQRIFSPEDAFIAISNWLSREKYIPDTQTNTGKIISHGFDTKTSFRKM